MSEKSNVAIIGKSVLGKELYDYLSKHVKHVKIISRSEGITYDRETFKKLLKDSNIIIWTSGGYKNKRTIWEEHVNNLQELVNALHNNQRLIFTSSISVYGKKLTNVVKETHHIQPDTLYAKAKAKGEEIAIEHRNSTIFRLGLLYSHKYKGYQVMFSLVEKGFAIYFGDGNNNVPFTYIYDVLTCYKSAIEKKIKKIEIFNITGKGCKQIEAINILAEVMQKNPIYLRMPKCIGFFCDFFNCFLNSEAIHSISSNRVINNEKAIKMLDFKETSIHEGIKKEVEKWKEMKKKM